MKPKSKSIFRSSPHSEQGFTTASAATGDQRQRRLSGLSYQSREVAGGQQGAAESESYSRSARHYRSRSELGSPRRYASQTLLDGTRPGPSAPHSRRDALQSLQRELDSLSRSPRTTAATAAAEFPAASAASGYTSDLEYSRSAAATSTARGAGGGFDYGGRFLNESVGLGTSCLVAPRSLNGTCLF